MKYCPKCAAQNEDSAVCCQACGANFNQAPISNPVPTSEPGKGLAVASLVCGIVSFFCFGIVLGILAVIFGAVAKSKGYTGAMATAGIVLGVIGLAIYLIMLVACGGGMLAIPGLY